MKTFTQLSSLFTLLVLLNSCSQKTAEVKPIRKNVTETVFASGVLVPDDNYNLTAQNDGYLINLNFMEGDTFKAGKVLAVIENKQNAINASSTGELLGIAQVNAAPDAPVLKQAEANLNLAQKKMAEDELQAERYKKLYDTKSVSKLEYENANLALDNSQAAYKVQQENYRAMKLQAEQQLILQKAQTDVNGVVKNQNEIRAVVGGKVYKKLKELGDYVRKGDVIAVVGDPDNLYVKLSIDESNISKIKLDQKVIIQLNTNMERNYNGKVTEIYPAFDDQTQSFYCKVRFTDPLDFKISGTQLQGNIVIRDKNNVLVIPKNYLGYGNKVNVKGKGLITVETGFVSTEWVEIVSGLDENSVITLDHP
jgi:multidrug efflux pump subunit AcrA (membrane-fusion protein)